MQLSDIVAPHTLAIGASVESSDHPHVKGQRAGGSLRLPK